LRKLKELFGLDGKVALVTGASRGIGRAIAIAFSEVGAIVVGVGRTNIQEMEKEPFSYQNCDITNIASVRDIVETIYGENQRIDILVNCAGITVPSGDSADQQANFRDSVATNLSAAFDMCSCVIPKMIKGEYGSIINVTSIAAGVALPGNPGYAASKGGLAALTRALALDFGEHGIRVNNLVPGYFPTDMTRKSYEDEDARRLRADRTMLSRWGDLDELVGAAIFLASPSSKYITGNDLFVDGGWSVKGL